MQLSFEQYERIQQYLDGKMPPEQVAAFLEEINKDLVMKEHLSFEQELREQLFFLQAAKDFEDLEDQGITSHEEKMDQEIKKKIADTAAEWKKKKVAFPLRSVNENREKKLNRRESVSRRIWYFAAAASVLLVILSIALWYSSGPHPADTVVDHEDTMQKKRPIIIKDPRDTSKQIKEVLPDKDNINYASLAGKYYKKDEAPFPENVPQYLRKALADYNNDNYSTITKIDLSGPSGTRGNTTEELQEIGEVGHYYKGLAFIETNENKKAIENLKWVVDSAKSQLLVVKGQWYLGLVHLSNDNPEAGRSLLKKVQSNNVEKEYKKKAGLILKELGGD